MAAYRRVYDSRHLQADCQEPGSAPEPYARQSSMGWLPLCLSGVVVGVTDGRDYHGDSNGSEWHVGRSAQQRRAGNVSVYVHTVRRRIRRRRALRPPRDWTPRCHRLSHRRPRLVGWNLGGRLSKLTMAFNCLLTSVVAVVNVNEVRWGYIVVLWWLLHFVY